MGAKVQPHDGSVSLRGSFEEAYNWLQAHPSVELVTAAGTPFSATATVARDGRKVIRFFQRSKEYARAYPCCWGSYHNCSRTLIGMYCVALDDTARSQLYLSSNS